MRKIDSTESVCHICNKKIPAIILRDKNQVFIEKKCPEHGKFIAEHIWGDIEIYRKFARHKAIEATPAQTAVILTYKCNLNCPICLANANKLKFSDFKIKNLTKAKGSKAVLLTGGEPTVREDLDRIIAKIKRGGQKVVLLSNGLKLADKKYALKLKRAGLDWVRLQFDAMDRQDSLHIRGRDLISLKRQAIKNLESLNIKITLCTVLIKRNLNKLPRFFNFVFKHPKIRHISANPLWKIGRYREEDFVSSREIIEKISTIFNLKKSDWIESTIFLIDLDNFMSLFGKRYRHFCQCNIKCLLLRDKEEMIPITKIFNLRKIHLKLTDLQLKKSFFKTIRFFLYLLINQVILNFLTNKYFRIFFLRCLANIKTLFQGKSLFSNIFYSVSVEYFMTKENFDLRVSRACNLDGLSPESLEKRPACLSRSALMN